MEDVGILNSDSRPRNDVRTTDVLMWLTALLVLFVATISKCEIYVQY
jgi:hypothetical protein